MVIFAPLIQAASNLPADPSALESSISALESAISALERDIKALEGSSALWEPLVWVFSALVVVGVVMELWVVRYDWREEMEAWAIWHFIGVTRSPSRPPLLKLWVEIASVVLISIGVAGELGVGVEISHINGLIRDKASEARTKNGELREKSDQLVALINREAGDAEAKAASAEAAAEAERLSRAKIEADVAWRSLDDKQKQEIGKALARFSPKAGASIWYDSSSTEAQVFSADIAEALRSGHITTTSVGGKLAMGEGGKWNGTIMRLPTGVIVQSTNVPAAIEFADAVVKELLSRGFDAIRQTDPPFEKGSNPVIWINVDARPKGPQGEYKLQAEREAKAKNKATARK